MAKIAFLLLLVASGLAAELPSIATIAQVTRDDRLESGFTRKQTPKEKLGDRWDVKSIDVDQDGTILVNARLRRISGWQRVEAKHAFYDTHRREPSSKAELASWFKTYRVEVLKSEAARIEAWNEYMGGESATGDFNEKHSWSVRRWIME